MLRLEDLTRRFEELDLEMRENDGIRGIGWLMSENREWVGGRRVGRGLERGGGRGGGGGGRREEGRLRGSFLERGTGLDVWGGEGEGRTWS